MSNKDNPPNDEEQLAAIPTGYAALLGMTRPLVVAEHTLAAWRGGEICRSGFATSPGPGDGRAESTLRRGEIFRSDESGLGIAEDEELATTLEEAGTSSAPEVQDAAVESISALRRRDSSLQMRICLGMS